MRRSHRRSSREFGAAFNFFLVSAFNSVHLEARPNTGTELGLVDEAKATVDKWMARWIRVVSSPATCLLQRI